MLLKEDLVELSRLASVNCANRGEVIVSAGEKASTLVIHWLHYLRSSQLTGHADCLIDGTASAVREGISCLALGLVRQSLSSLRLQIDLSLAWLYFKDHPVEWRRVQETGDGFKMKTELLKYLAETETGFASRFGLLKEIRTRTIEEPYRLLSAHIHGQSESVLPQVLRLKDIVADQKSQEEALQLQEECSEYINDVFWSMYSSRWASIPVPIKSSLESRFKTTNQRTQFFI